MRVMLVVNEFPPEKVAGTAMATQALADYLMIEGHTVCVVVTTNCPKKVEQQIAPHDYELIWLKPRPFRGLGWLWRVGQTFKHAKRFKPDVIQGQAVSCGFIAGVVGRLLGFPSICYAQGYDVYQSSWLQKKTEIRWGCTFPNQCLVVTKDLGNFIKQVVDVPLTLMPHAFELPTLPNSREEIRAKYHLAETTKFVFNVARLESFKGHDILLQAWRQCLEIYPDAQLWIAGTGSLRQSLEKMVYDLGIQDNVRFLGFLPKDEVHQLMEAAEMFVLPSLSEPFGIVLLEAMAHGLPVVASKVGGIPEVLPAKGITWLVPPGDVKDLSAAMLQALKDDLCPAILNQQYALDFTWEKQVKRFEKVYFQLIKKL